MVIVRTILITSVIIAPIATYAGVPAKCADATYQQDHPYECYITDKYMLGAGILGATAIAAMGLGTTLNTLDRPSTHAPDAPALPTLRTYETYQYVGGDVTESHLATIKMRDQYIKNQSQYDTIRLEYALARGLTGQGTSIAILDSASWHGNAVAAIAGGTIAPDATITRHYVIDQDNSFIPYYDIGDIIGNANTNVINASWNTQMRATAVKSRAQISNITDPNFINGITDAALGGTIFVWAAGNDGAPQSGALSALPHVMPELEGHFINVVAWDDERGDLAGYSNECGITMQYCITAPGTGIDAGGRIVSGTSFAAPVVSAAIASIRQAFPYMTANEITDLILTTARDLGTPGVDSVYGHGMLDMERASRPVGTPVVPLATGLATPLQTTRVSGAIGKKIHDNAALKLAFIDNYGRAFQTNMRDHIKIVNPGRGYSALYTPPQTSAHTGPFEFGFRHSNFLAGNGIFGTDESNTITFVALNHEFGTPYGKIFLRPELGTGTPHSRPDSIITKFSNIYTAGLRLGATYNNWRATITVPDMIIGGNMQTYAPIARDARGEILFQSTNISLRGMAPIEYAVSYKYITAAFVDNPIGTDEFFIVAKRAFAF